MELQQVSEVYRKAVLIGEDMDTARRGKKRLVARSECRFVCDDDETLERCVQHLKLSDEHLRKRPEEMVLWDWQSTFIEREAYSDKPGGVVILGVAWYDETFLMRKRKPIQIHPI